MKLISICFIFLVFSSHYIEATQKTVLYGKQGAMSNQQINDESQDIQQQVNHSNAKSHKNIIRHNKAKHAQQLENQVKFDPISIGMMVAGKIVGAVTSFAKKYENQYKEEMEQAKVAKQDSLLSDKKLVQNLVEQDCLFYQNLKHIVNSHLITLDLQLAIVQKSYKPSKRYQFRNSRSVLSTYKSLDHLQFNTEQGTEDLPNDEIQKYITEIRILKDQIVQLLNKKKAVACSVKGTQFQQSQSELINKNLDDIIADLESNVEPKKQTQKKLVDQLLDKVKQTFIKSAKEKAAQDKLKQQIYEYQQVLIRFTKDVQKDQELLVKNIKYEDMRADFDKIYSQFFKVEVTAEYHKLNNLDLSMSHYHQKIGQILSHIYVSYQKAGKIEDLRQSSNIKGQVESNLSLKDKSLLNIVKVLEYLEYAKQIWDLGLGGLVEDQLSKEQKETEKIVIELYNELFKLISLQIDFSLQSNMGDTQKTEASRIKTQRDIQFWKFGKLIAKQSVTLIVKQGLAKFSEISKVIGNPLELILSTFEMFETLYNVFRLWKAKKAQKIQYADEAIQQTFQTENVVLESEYGKCQTMNLLFDILNKQKEYMEKLQPLSDQATKTATATAIQPIIKDYFKELCDVDIYTCIGTFSLKFYEDLMGQDQANQLFQYLMFQSKQGPITNVHATDQKEDEQTLISMGYQLYTEVQGTQFRIFVCRFCDRSSYIDYIRVLSGQNYQAIYQLTQVETQNNPTLVKLKDRKSIFTATRLQNQLKNEAIQFLVTREVYFDSTLGDIESDILREFEIYRYIQDKSNSVYEIKSIFQSFSKKRNSWIQFKSTEVELNKFVLADKNLLKYNYILLTQDVENTSCDIKLNATKRYQLFEKQYQLEQAYQSFQVFGYFGVARNEQQFEELKTFGCKIVYNIDLQNMQKYQDGSYFSFKVDFESRSPLYLANKFQIVSPTTFELDANKGVFYQVYFKPIFQDYTLNEELMLAGKPSFKPSQKSDLIDFVNQYICQRQVRQNNELNQAQCVFQDDSISLKLKSGSQVQSELMNYPFKQISKYNIINSLMDPIELKALSDKDAPKISLFNWHLNQLLQTRAFLNKALSDILNKNEIIDALHQYLTTKSSKDQSFKDLKKLVVFIPIQLDQQCLSNEANYASVDKINLQIDEYCAKSYTDNNNIPIYKKLYIRVAIGIDEAAFIFRSYSHTDDANYLYLPRLSAQKASVKTPSNKQIRVQIDFLVKPLYEFGNMILSGTGFKLTVSQGIFKKDKVISQYSSQCYTKVDKTPLVAEISAFAEKNSLTDQQVIQYQMLDNLRSLKTANELRATFGEYFLTSGTRVQAVKQRGGIYQQVEESCSEKTFWGNPPDRNQLEELTWYIPARISENNNYLEFQYVESDGLMDKLVLQETTINTMENLPMHSLYYIELIYNAKNVKVSSENQQHQTLIKYGFRPLTVPKNIKYKSYYQNYDDKKQAKRSQGDKSDIIEDIHKKEIDIGKLNDNDLMLNTIQYDLFESDGDAIYPYQRPIAQRVWIRYDPRVQGAFYDKCEFNPHITAQLEQPSRTPYDTLTKAQLFRHQKGMRFQQQSYIHNNQIDMNILRKEQQELKEELDRKVNFYLFNE